MFFNHGVSPAYAKSTAGRRTTLINARPGRARSPSVPHWRVAVSTFFALVLIAFASDPAITVSARQRYPWNGLVDINFAITGDAGTKYDTDYLCEHPTEAGMVRISDRMIPVCEKIIDNL